MSVWTDGRQALRRIRRAPLFSAVVALTMGIGLGINATANSLLYAVVLRPISAPAPEQLVTIARTNEQGQSRSTRLPLLQAVGDDRDLFVEAASYAGAPIVTVEWNGRISPHTIEFVGAHYFEMLGARAAAGRLLTASDLAPGATADPVVVLSQRIWHRFFGGDVSMIGREVRIEGVPVRVLGITDARFTGLQVDVAADLVMPVALMSTIFGQPSRPPQAAMLIARLQRGRSIEQVRERLALTWSALLSSTSVQMSAQERRELAVSRWAVEPVGRGFSPLRNRYTTALYLLSTLGLGLLILTMVNVAALLLSRASGRADEFFVRTSLGATRGRMVRQLLLEATLIALAAIATGLLLAWWASQWLAAASWTGLLPMTLRVTPDTPVLLVTVLFGAVGGAGIGALPALCVAANQTSGLRADRRAVRSSRRGGLLLACQIGLSVPVVFTAGLLLRTLENLQSAEPGIDGRQVLLLKLVPQPGGYEKLDAATYYPALADALSALPGVARVSFSQLFPAVANEASLSKVVQPAGGNGNTVHALVETVSPHFFEITRIPRISGRDIAWNDDNHAPQVALVNLTLAQRLFGTAHAVGRRVAIGSDATGDVVEIIGVVASSTMGNLRSRDVPVLFRPTLQAGRSALSPFVEIRATGNPRDLQVAARQVVESIGREYALVTDTLEGYLSRSLARERTTAGAVLLLAGFSLVLACASVYAQLAHAVTRRMPEIGLRIAMGATNASVAWRIAADGLLATAVGLTVGLPAAIALASIWRNVLFDVRPLDVATIIAATAAFLLAAGGAAWIPATRASRIEPIVALRTE